MKNISLKKLTFIFFIFIIPSAHAGKIKNANGKNYCVSDSGDYLGQCGSGATCYGPNVGDDCKKAKKAGINQPITTEPEPKKTKSNQSTQFPFTL